MNRQIKFRAWDKEKKVMIHDQDQKVGKIYDIPLGSYIPNTVRRIGDYHGTYMQYTGLLDSDGKEIFESDVVSSNDHWKGTVWWCNSTGQWWANDHPLCELNKLKVIGSVFENPELLEGEV